MSAGRSGWTSDPAAEDYPVEAMVRPVPAVLMGRRAASRQATGANANADAAQAVPPASSASTLRPNHAWPPRSVPAELRGESAATDLWLRAASLRDGGPLVCVSSADGGVGRSTLVAALGSLLALACPQPPIAVDMTGRAWGGLEHRVRRRSQGSVWDATRVGRLTDRTQVQQWTQLGPTGLEVLTGEPEMTSARRPPLHSEIAVVVAALRGLYPLVLVDLPPADQHSTWTALTWAAAPVLVARASVDSLQHTMRLVARMRAVGLADVVDRTVVVVMAVSQAAPRQIRAAQIQAAHAVGELVTVPYDAALARPEPIDVRSLRRVTRSALVRVGAVVMNRCPADPHLVCGTQTEAAAGHEEATR